MAWTAFGTRGRFGRGQDGLKLEAGKRASLRAMTSGQLLHLKWLHVSFGLLQRSRIFGQLRPHAQQRQLVMMSARLVRGGAAGLSES